MTTALDAVRVSSSVSDRASHAVYVDKGLPALKEWLTRAAQPGDL
jgi:molybdopterin adenylyltransferase